MIGLKKLLFSSSSLAVSCYRKLLDSLFMAVCYRTAQSASHILSCSLNQPIATLVSISIETVHKLLNWAFFQMEIFFPLNNDYTLEDKSDFIVILWYTCLCQLSRRVSLWICDMFRWSWALHSIIYRFATTANEVKHPPNWNTTAQYAIFSSVENPHFVKQNTGTIAVDHARFPLVSDEEISEMNTNKSQPPKNIARATKSWTAGWEECCKARNINVFNCQWKTGIISHR